MITPKVDHFLMQNADLMAHGGFAATAAGWWFSHGPTVLMIISALCSIAGALARVYDSIIKTRLRRRWALLQEQAEREKAKARRG